MPFEKYNQNDDTERAERERFTRPEDDLETPEIVEVRKRERAFSAEGGFQNLLRLKIALNDLRLSYAGILQPGVNCNFMIELIDDPKTYAVSALGFDINKKEISDEELQSALKDYLEKARTSIATQMDKYLSMITEYGTTTQSDALKSLEYMVNNCKKSALAGDWESYCDKATKAQSHFNGLEKIVELCCGSAVENDSTRKVVGAPVKK